MAERNKTNNPLQIALIGLLVAAAFLIGGLWTKVKTLENGGEGERGAAGAETAASRPFPTTPPVSEEVLNKMRQSPFALGSESAPVTIIDVSDFNCPWCAEHAGADAIPGRGPSEDKVLEKIKERYINSGKVRYVFVGRAAHDNSLVHEAAWCAYDQGKFWEYHDLLFQNFDQRKREDLTQFARQIGLNTNKFDDCLDNRRHREDVAGQFQLSNEAYMTGTPAFLINQERIEGAATWPSFETTIENQLKAK